MTAAAIPEPRALPFVRHLHHVDMVVQVAPHPGQVGHNRDAQLLQRLPRSDAATQITPDV